MCFSLLELELYPQLLVVILYCKTLSNTRDVFPVTRGEAVFCKTYLSLKKGAYYQGHLSGRGDSVLKCSHIKTGVVLQYFARICVSAGIPHSCPGRLNSTAAVTTRLRCLKLETAFVNLNGKTDTKACNWPGCLSTGWCFLVMLLAFHLE